MKYLITILLLTGSLNLAAQVKTAPEGYQYFEMESGDSTIIMKQYFLCLLKSGLVRDQSEEEAAEIQKGHLAHLARLHEEGHACITGPMEYDGEIRGIVIYKTPTLEAADSLARLDPAVKSGRLEVEVIPWWAMKGAVLN